MFKKAAEADAEWWQNPFCPGAKVSFPLVRWDLWVRKGRGWRGDNVHGVTRSDRPLKAAKIHIRVKLGCHADGRDRKRRKCLQAQVNVHLVHVIQKFHNSKNALYTNEILVICELNKIIKIEQLNTYIDAVEWKLRIRWTQLVSPMGPEGVIHPSII